jgi:hypothetical protein
MIEFFFAAEPTPLPIRVLGHPDTLARRCKTS